MTKKYTLPKEFAEKWVKALRSGRYRQGDEGLYFNSCYCCLGVGCIVAGATPEEIVGEATAIVDIDSTFRYFKISDKEFYKRIPKEIKGNAIDNDLVSELVKLNDEKGETFPEIADWIEANVKFTESEVQSA